MSATSPPKDPSSGKPECLVCREAYRRPRILPCGHTLCQIPCLGQIINCKPRFSCPECRSEHAVPKSGPSGFPMNVAISRLTEEPSKVLQALPGCPICGEDVVLLKCHHCKMEICDECRFEHTPRFRKQLCDALEEFQEEICSKKSACTSLVTSLKEEVKVTTNLACSDIKKASEDLIKAIRQNVKQLKQKVQKFAEDEYESINYQAEESLRHLNNAAEFCGTELKELNSDSRLSHVRLAKIQNEFREHSTGLSKRRRVMSVRRKINVHFKPAAEDFCDVLIAQDKVSEQETNTVAEIVNTTNSLLEHTFTTPKMSIGSAIEGPENLSGPAFVAVDPDNKNIFITDHINHRVQVFDRSGRHKFAFGSNGHGKENIRNPAGILISRKRRVIVADKYNHRVKVHNINGSCIIAFGRYGSEPGMLRFPNGIAQDSDENIHVCDTKNKRVQIFTENGQLKGAYDSWKIVADDRPYNISISDSGRIAIQLESNIVILNNEKQLLWHTQSPTSVTNEHNYFCGISFIDDNHFFLTNRHYNSIHLYSSKDEYTSMADLVSRCCFQGSSKHFDVLNQPCGIAIDGADVYVVCKGSRMVHKF